VETIDEVLEHFGVKGMKWGVRRSHPGISGSHEDAARAKQAKAKVKKGGTDALSNRELEDLVRRMNLEKQFSSLQPPSGKKRAGKFVADLLVNVGKQQVSKAANDALGKQVGRLLASR